MRGIGEQNFEVVFAFFRARKGRAYGFRFRDWTDFEATGQAMLATTSPTVWQLVRRYLGQREVAGRKLGREGNSGIVGAPGEANGARRS